MSAVTSVVVLCVLLLAMPASIFAAPKAPDFVTSQVCARCHETQFKVWQGSHHSWAWREPTAENVLGDFANVVFEHRGFSYRFETEEGMFFITADGPDGAAVRYAVRYVVGVTPLQQYLVETHGGRLQALDVAWDTETNHWYHLYPEQDTSAGNGLHWSGAYKNWNSRCAECHATDYQKNYAPATDAYRSRQAEIGVGCEACHGPGQAHLQWAGQPDAFDPARWQGVGIKGLSSVREEIGLCAGCHSRREPLGADSPPVGGAFDRHYRLALLRDGLYFADGQINDEVYVYGSYLQSRMYDKGVTCTQCHEPHSYRLKLKGNALCTQCHNPRGNPIYPSLPRGQYDSATHHFHPPGSDGAACVNCHMPARTYMGVDARRDHSFRIPRPDLSQRLGVPNPCTQCHQEKNAQWAAAEISRRFPGGRANGEHFAMLFSQSERETSGQAGNQLLDLANDPSRPAIVRASALMRFSGAASSVSSKSVQKLLRDQSPLVRMAAIGLHPLLPEAQRVEVLAPLLSDPVQSVRLEAAKAFLGIPQTQIPASARLPLKQAMGEWQRSLMARADFPETQMVLGGVALALRNLPAASRAFGRATEMDPQLVDAWLMLARIEAVQGNREKVVRTLTQALRVNPDNTALRQALAEISP